MKKNVVLSLSLAFALLVSGCGAGAGNTEPAGAEPAGEEITATASETAEPVSESPAATAVADESGSYYQETVEGSVLNIGVGSSVTSWNPWSNGMNAATSGSMGGMLYQTLMTMEMEPVLAYEYEAVDDTTYDFHIWDNITDSLGNPLTAEDVVFSYEQGIASGNAHGIDIIETVTALDDYTVEFTFSHEPYIGDLESVVGQISIVTRASYEASSDNMVNTPVGTGAYVLDKWVADSITTLTVRDDFWAKPEQILSPSMECSVETVNYKVISESAQLTIGLENGDIDFSNAITNEDLSFFEEGGEYAANYNVDILPAGLTNYLLCNCSENSVCSDPVLREAIYYAIDAQSIVNGVANGMGIVTHDGSNATLQDYNTDWNEEDNYYNYNLETAKKKLEEAGYADGKLTLTLYCESGDLYTNISTLVQAFLNQLGINVNIEPYESTMLADYVADSKSWDLLVCCFGSEDYIVNNWAHICDPANWSWGKSYNFIDDDKLVELLYTCKTLDGHTPENLDAFHKYATDNAYMMGLYNGYSCAVMNNKYSAVYNIQNNLIAQATIFN